MIEILKKDGVRLRHLVAAGVTMTLLGCASTPPSTPPAPIESVPFSEAVLKAANTVFANAPAKPASGPGAAQPLVIDPLIDGLTGAESVATQSMEGKIVDLVKTKYPKFAVKEFSASNVSKSPQVLIGTFTGVNGEGKTAGVRESFRICLALLDLEAGKVVSKARVFAKPEGVDITPTPFFRDSPAWTPDPVTEAYIKTCQATKPGDPIFPVYLERIRAAALLNEAITAYDNKQYRKAQGLYATALQTEGGNQLRAYNGLYLTSWKLGDRRQATDAFAKVVDHGLTNQRLGVKFLFRPGTTEFIGDRALAGQYDVWLAQIAQRTAQRDGCLEVEGHTSRTGPEPVNERLSLRRAEYVQRRLAADAPTLGTRTVAAGRGSQETLVGSGTDDLRDAIDRRVEFNVIKCATSS